MSDLNVHMKTHVLVNKKKNVRTENMHVTEKKYKCEYCMKAFNSAGTLKNHIRMHIGEKSNICEYCEKAFSRAGSLTRQKNPHRREAF